MFYALFGNLLFLLGLIFLFLCLRLLYRVQVESFGGFFQVLLILEVIVTDELLLGQFQDFLFVHATDVQSFWASNALKNGHSISADPTTIAVVQRASEMKGVRINILEMLLDIIVLDTFGVEIFGAVGC